ncbi:MAG: hypothetical protein QF775_02350 [archaeon]|jgi:hypothetical protein|nr:hypothetical protein [Euryarchaeota archaeon]MDP6704302.1 hypothetical protein [archaeon]|tara:strand:- start:36122 stop:36445 length:324 start_codon:yes stop_codon:yes gene_type:complete
MSKKGVSIGMNMLVVLALAVFVVFLVSNFFFNEARESAGSIGTVGKLATNDTTDIGGVLSAIPSCYPGDPNIDCDDSVCCDLTYAKCRSVEGDVINGENKRCVWEIR